MAALYVTNISYCDLTSALGPINYMILGTSTECSAEENDIDTQDNIIINK